MDKDIFIQRGEKFVRLPLKSVVYFTATEEGCEAIMVSRKRIFIGASLNYIAPYLPDWFHRIHESCIINEQKVDSFSKTQMWLIGGYKLPMTKKGFRNLTKGRLVCDGSLAGENPDSTNGKTPKNDLGNDTHAFSDN